MIITILISIYILSIFGCRNAARLCLKHDIWLKTSCGAKIFWFVPVINTIATVILNGLAFNDIQSKKGVATQIKICKMV